MPRSVHALLLVAAATLCLPAAPLDEALSLLYNFRFTEANEKLHALRAAAPEDPLPCSFLAASYLFAELDRLGILQSEFFADDKGVMKKEKLAASAEVKSLFLAELAESDRRVTLRLARDAKDADALLAHAMNPGLETDYLGLVERRQLASLTPARVSQKRALLLLESHPSSADAYVTTGMTDYLYGSVPFFVRWFLRFEGADASKDRAIQKLRLAANSGRYLGPFARILLCTILLREKRKAECVQQLEQLAKDFPRNPLFAKELARLKQLP
jgi:hypothetical protein